MSKTVLTGIQPSGQLHVGNFFGAVLPLVTLAKSSPATRAMIADQHALTTVREPATLRASTAEIAGVLLAAGLPDDAILFRQSDVPEHQELAWYLSCLTTVPYLMRAHAFKDAEAKGKELSAGTFYYPVLMAADILAHGSDLVPVGRDQQQHIEFARDFAGKMNNAYGEGTLKLPEGLISEEVGTVPGTDGRKMSKSYGNVIPLLASREELAKRVMSIVTDSSGGVPQNVYAIHALLRPKAELDALYAEKAGKYKDLKEALLADLDARFAPLRERYAALAADPAAIETRLANGAAAARAAAGEVLSRVRKAVGIR
jgi:tryptophanyl-tRNA synthetase